MIPSYKTNAPHGWCGDPKRGAAMGRHSTFNAPNEISCKLALRRIDLNNGGYDSEGTYWGVGVPLYWYASEDYSIESQIRAHDRDEAKQKIRVRFPNARFYR